MKLLAIVSGLLLAAVGWGSVPRNLYSDSDFLAACDNGVKAFEQTVFPLIRKDCADCHDQGGMGPPHSVSEVQKSYARILAYVDWNDKEHSRLVEKGGSRHCLEYPGGKCVTTQEDMRKVLNEWWEKGQKECPSGGSVATKPVAIPKDLPTGKTFAKMEFAMGSINELLERATLELEIQKLADPRDRQEYYLIRKPRLVLPTRAVYVEGIQFLVNGKFDAGADAFTTARASVHPVGKELTGTLLSSAVVAVTRDKDDGDELQLTFDQVKMISTPDCKRLDLFQKELLPVFKARRCYSCHAGGEDNFPGKSPAKDAWNMKLTDEELCRTALQRGGGRFPVDSPLISLPLRGAVGHPKILASPSEALPGWLDWLHAEN